MFFMMCSAAKKAGDLRVLLPRDMHPFEMPWMLAEAIQHMWTVASWYENLQEKEIPPQYLWDDAEGLEEWFERVYEARGYDKDGKGENNVGQPDRMVDNDLAREWRTL